jgi:hypothetical protein
VFLAGFYRHSKSPHLFRSSTFTSYYHLLRGAIIIIIIIIILAWLVKRDLWRWMLRPKTTTEWEFIFFSSIVVCKLTFFCSLFRIHCQASHWHCITFIWQLWNANLKTFCNSYPEWILLVLLPFFEILLQKASRWNDLVIKCSKSNQSCFARTIFPLAVKRDLWLWIMRP